MVLAVLVCGQLDGSLGDSEAMSAQEKQTALGIAHDGLRQSRADHLDMGALLEAWARESVDGGWSTHQVDAMRRRSDVCRAFARSCEDAIARSLRKSHEP